MSHSTTEEKCDMDFPSGDATRVENNDIYTVLQTNRHWGFFEDSCEVVAILDEKNYIVKTAVNCGYLVTKLERFIFMKMKYVYKIETITSFFQKLAQSFLEMAYSELKTSSVFIWLKLIHFRLAIFHD